MKIFKENPELDEVYETSDGNLFYTRNAAENHAKSLESKTVKRVVNPRSKDVAVVDADDPNVGAVGTIQTGEDAEGNPELKQILADTDANGNVQMHVVAVNDANSTEAQSANDANVAQKEAEQAKENAQAAAEVVAENVAKKIEDAASATEGSPAKAERAANKNASKPTKSSK